MIIIICIVAAIIIVGGAILFYTSNHGSKAGKAGTANVSYERRVAVDRAVGDGDD